MGVRLLLLLLMILLVMAVPVHADSAVFVVGKEQDGLGGQWRAAPLCVDRDVIVMSYEPLTIHYRAVIVAENRYRDDNWGVYIGYKNYNSVRGEWFYTVAQKLGELPFRDDRVYTNPYTGRPVLFYFIVYNNTVYAYNGEKIAELPAWCRPSVTYGRGGDGVALYFSLVDWPPVTMNDTTTTQPPETPTQLLEEPLAGAGSHSIAIAALAALTVALAIIVLSRGA